MEKHNSGGEKSSLGVERMMGEEGGKGLEVRGSGNFIGSASNIL